MKKLLIIAFALLIGNVWAGRPLAIDDADPADRGTFEVETAVFYEQGDGSEHYHIPLVLTYGIWTGVEIGIEAGGRVTKENGDKHEDINDLLIGAKWQFLKEKTWIPRMAVIPTIKLPTASRKKGGTGEIDGDLTFAASKLFFDKWGVHVNVGYGLIGPPEDEDVDDVLHYGVALDYQLFDRLQWVGEVFAERDMIGGSPTMTLYNTGLRWNPIPDLTLDCSAGSSLSKEGPDLIATAGLTWAFGGK